MKLDDFIVKISIIRKPLYFYRVIQILLWREFKHSYECIWLSDYIATDMSENPDKYFWIKTKMVR